MVGLICFFILVLSLFEFSFPPLQNYILRAKRPICSDTPKNVNTFFLTIFLTTNPPSREATPKVFASRRRDGVDTRLRQAAFVRQSSDYGAPWATARQAN